MLPRLADRLRFLADRLDPWGAPRYMAPYSFTVEVGEGIRFREDGRGCPLMYARRDHERAFEEADRPVWPFDSNPASTTEPAT